MRILHVAAECYPLLKTGGLADVVAALPVAQRAAGEDARILLPGFPAIMAALVDGVLVANLAPRFGASAISLWLGKTPDSGVPLFVIEAPGLYDRPGNPYVDGEQKAYPDNHRRFALLSRVAVQLACGELGEWRPEVLHAHDWHAGLAPAYLHHANQVQGQRAAVAVTTVHTLAYQGISPADLYSELQLPRGSFGIDGIEFHGQISFLKAALYYSDRLATVSPSYALEIQSAEHGCGLDGLLRVRQHDLVGILNGVDYRLWDPTSDQNIEARYDAARLAGKARCKSALQKQLGLAQSPDALLFGVVSRLTEQKGLHLVIGGARALLARGGQIAVLGNGDLEMENAFRELMAEYPQQVGAVFEFDEALSHRIFAGTDVIMVPSRFEPCGLTQLYGLRYGTLPLVRRTGGLADTVVDCTLENLADNSATGFVFDQFAQRDFDAAVRRAYALAGKPSMWRDVRRQAMARHFDWQGPAQAYVNLYRSALG